MTYRTTVRDAVNLSTDVAEYDRPPNLVLDTKHLEARTALTAKLDAALDRIDLSRLPYEMRFETEFVDPRQIHVGIRTSCGRIQVCFYETHGHQPDDVESLFRQVRSSIRGRVHHQVGKCLLFDGKSVPA